MERKAQKWLQPSNYAGLKLQIEPPPISQRVAYHLCPWCWLPYPMACTFIKSYSIPAVLSPLFMFLRELKKPESGNNTGAKSHVLSQRWILFKIYFLNQNVHFLHNAYFLMQNIWSYHKMMWIALPKWHTTWFEKVVLDQEWWIRFLSIPLLGGKPTN